MCVISELKKKKSFKDKIDKCMSHQFDEKMSVSMKKKIKQDNTYDITIIVFYNNSRSLIFKVLGGVVNLFVEKYVCVLIICVFKEKENFQHHTEYLRIIYLMSSQALVYQKLY